MTCVGIDLGTTNSLISIFKDGRAEVLKNELDEIMTPSVVAVGNDGALLVGRAAKDHLVNNPQNGVACFKRDMGTTKNYEFGAKSWSPIELSAVVLKELKRIAELRLGEPVTEAVISVPAYFHDAPRQATLDAAQIAGLTVRRLINEPTAAALAYGCQNKDEEASLMVFDIGGGTFDVTILEVFDQIIDVKASGGISHLGGEDYLQCLVKLVCKKIGLDDDEATLSKLYPKVENLKRKLSVEDAVDFTYGKKTVEIKQDDFLQATNELTDRLKPIVIRCLRDAQVSLDELNAIILVGGASRMKIIQDLVSKFNSNVNNEIDPDVVVAEGASVQAALSEEDHAVKDMVLTDVAPHSLGVEVSRQMRLNRFEDGLFSPIIDRNTTLPVSRSNIYSTAHPLAEEVELHIFQGEHRYVRENQHLGKIKVTGLRGKTDDPMSGSCEVRFTYDMNGILEVDVTVLHSGKKFNALIEERPGHLSKEQIEKIIKKLKPLKVSLRDKLPNRARIERAVCLYEELNGAFRVHLDELLMQFEAALDVEDIEAVAWTGKALDQFLETYYGSERDRSQQVNVEVDKKSVDEDEKEVSGPWLPNDDGDGKT